jgi:hypothetical protein
LFHLFHVEHPKLPAVVPELLKGSSVGVPPALLECHARTPGEGDTASHLNVIPKL